MSFKTLFILSSLGIFGGYLTGYVLRPAPEQAFETLANDAKIESKNKVAQAVSRGPAAPQRTQNEQTEELRKAMEKVVSGDLSPNHQMVDLRPALIRLGHEAENTRLTPATENWLAGLGNAKAAQNFRMALLVAGRDEEDARTLMVTSAGNFLAELASNVNPGELRQAMATLPPETPSNVTQALAEMLGSSPDQHDAALALLGQMTLHPIAAGATDDVNSVVWAVTRTDDRSHPQLVLNTIQKSLNSQADPQARMQLASRLIQVFPFQTSQIRSLVSE